MEPETFVDLGKQRFAKVAVYKGNVRIDVREYYVEQQTGTLKPGTKGISLSPDQFVELMKGFVTLMEGVNKEIARGNSV